MELFSIRIRRTFQLVSTTKRQTRPYRIIYWTGNAPFLWTAMTGVTFLIRLPQMVLMHLRQHARCFVKSIPDALLVICVYGVRKTGTTILELLKKYIIITPQNKREYAQQEYRKIQ